MLSLLQLILGTHHGVARHPTHSPIAFSNEHNSDVQGLLTSVALQLQTVEDQRKALDRREEDIEENERDLRENSALLLKHIEERENETEALYIDVMEKAARLHSEQAQTVEQFQLAEQNAVSANYALIEVMEKKADLEDKERYLRGVEIALSKQHILIEERKQIIASEEAGLRHEKARLLDAKSAIEQEKSSIDDEKRMLIQEKHQAVTAATTALVAVDEESLSLEEGTFMTLEEAEYLRRKLLLLLKRNNTKPMFQPSYRMLLQ